MPDSQPENREHARGQNPAKSSVYEQKDQHDPGPQQSSQRSQSPDDLKKQARHAEADADRNRADGREMAERFANTSCEQIDRYERAYGEFWRVAESDNFMPFARHLARANMEFAGLASRRAKAYAEFPVQLTQCQSPNEFVNRQMRFVSDMLSDYQEAMSRITRTLVDGANPQQWMQAGSQQLGQAMGEFGEAMQAGGANVQAQGQSQSSHPGAQPGDAAAQGQQQGQRQSGSQR